MSDDYFVGDDKPFAENINDALLLSNVFDWTVPIELPKMFSNSTWVNSSSRRKAGVSVVTLDGGLPSGVSVSTVDDHSVLTGTGTVKIKIYPNFNVYGGISKIAWTCSSGSMTVKVEDTNGTTIVSSVSNGATLSEAGLKPLKEYVLVCSLSSATLTDLTITMVNTSSENRYGAVVKIPSVEGLSDLLPVIKNNVKVYSDSELTNQVAYIDYIHFTDASNNTFKIGRLIFTGTKSITINSRSTNHLYINNDSYNSTLGNFKLLSIGQIDCNWTPQGGVNYTSFNLTNETSSAITLKGRNVLI